MPKEIYLVKVGMSMTEGMVSEWFIPDGGEVKKGELVYALETEKVNLDVDAEYDGVVKHVVEVGVTLKPGDVVGYIFEANEEIPDDLGKSNSKASSETTVDDNVIEIQKSKETPEKVVEPQVVQATSDGRVKSSPAARRLAR